MTPTAHLSDDQRAELRAELERQLARLERSMKLTDEASRPVELDQTSVGRLSRMDSLQNQSLSKGLQEREVARHAELRDALERIAAGTYGVCTGCAAAIPFERLFVFPEASQCSGCVT